ncbi:MAG TPA: tRNA pseudouridine(55) synthase TruB [Candidatus Acidoferrales bacterium]|nr:tRNA pseudouridine(55) synthase TruB [Candidatus Acidoferrales bacterium]
MNPPFGFINAFKPPGPSSAAFGSWVKRVAGGVAVGHWGTLDPMACGVLVLGVGKATRLFPLIADATKSYVFELTVGEQTDSGDRAGTVIARAPVPEDWRERLLHAAAALVGPQLQVPPMHSAVKVAGSPLYRSARMGATVPRAARPTTIWELRVLAHDGRANTARLFVHCDAGTYVRVLCEDLGKKLGLPARMGALLRVASGPFVLRESATSERIARSLHDCLIDPLQVLTNPRHDLSALHAERFCAGNEVRVESPERVEAVNALDVLVVSDGTLLGTGTFVDREGQTVLAPTRVLAQPRQGS